LVVMVWYWHCVAHGCAGSWARAPGASGDVKRWASWVCRAHWFWYVIQSLQSKLQREQALVRYTKTVAGRWWRTWTHAFDDDDNRGVSSNAMPTRYFSGKMLLERDKKNKELQAQVRLSLTFSLCRSLLLFVDSLRSTSFSTFSSL
jgi:hypothetical protein